MANCEKIIATPYKRLLNHVNRLLGLLDPLYGTLNCNTIVACVIISLLCAIITTRFFAVVIDYFFLFTLSLVIAATYS